MAQYAAHGWDGSYNESALSRFWDKVDSSTEDGCWLWTGSPNASGYGRFRTGGAGSPDVPAHRFSFAIHGGTLVRWKHVHHVCGTKTCVNPAHLEQVTPHEHRERHPAPTECVHGHDLTAPTNVYRHRGVRYCRTCRRMQTRSALGITADRWKVNDEF